MVRENMSIITVVIGTIVMALAVEGRSFVHDDVKSLAREFRAEGWRVPAKAAVRKWPYWAGLFLIGAGTALRWHF